MKTWFVTGASRGLGIEIVRAALDRGDNVVATARAPGAITAALPGSDGRLLTVALDVTDPASVTAAVDAARSAFGAVDVLVNNAGHGLFGAVEEGTDASARALFDVNVFGLLAVTRAVVPHLRAQGSGHILNISSIAGLTALAGSGLYAASKHAVEAISGALREELAPHGVHVTAIEPGRFRTDFLDPSSMVTEPHVVDAYADLVRRDLIAAGNHAQPGDPRKLAAILVDLTRHEAPPAHLVLGADALGRARAEFQARLAELELWSGLSASTDIGE